MVPSNAAQLKADGRVRDIETSAVAALIFTPDGRYLMQLRDSHAHVAMRGHWGLFGGMIEPGESAEDALARELKEELALSLTRVSPAFTQVIYDLGFAGRSLHRKLVFEVPFEEVNISDLRLGEGQKMQLFAPDDLLHEPKVTPWDWYAVILHSRRLTVVEAMR